MAKVEDVEDSSGHDDGLVCGGHMYSIGSVSVRCLLGLM